MNIAKLTNKIALICILLLIYWVFIFVCMEVFGLKVFKSKITQLFTFSLMGIFVILFGTLILNIMHNLSVIAEHVKQVEAKPRNKTGWWISLIILSFPLLLGLLYWGNYLSNEKRERYLIFSAKTLQETQQDSIETLANYNFDLAYVKKSCQTLKYLSKVDENFPSVSVIQQDNMNNKQVNLIFTSSCYFDKNSDSNLDKVDFILRTSIKEREYLLRVFNGETQKPFYTGNGDKFELYYPVQTANGKFVLYLSKYSQYGKIGS